MPMVARGAGNTYPAVPAQYGEERVEGADLIDAHLPDLLLIWAGDFLTGCLFSIPTGFLGGPAENMD